ncbi:MAG TPA: hypothetical protein VMU22_12115 [Rhizomicrobium sp.]|nr:hypothetical protein [Rhizomicrobium sp.]
MARTNGLLILGVILVIVGLVALAIPEFTTRQTDQVAKLGPLNVQATHDTTHVIPPLLSGGVLVLGIVLVGVGVAQRR